MKIILAGDNLKPQITELICQVQESQGLQGNPLETEKYLLSLMDQGNPVLIALTENNNVAGVLILQLRFSLLDGGERALVDEVVVASSYQGEGVGAALVQAAVQVAQARKCTKIEVCTAPENRKALAFYSRQGFIQKGILMEMDLV